MKGILLSFLVFMAADVLWAQSDKDLQEIQEFRTKHAEDFMNPEESPLEDDSIPTFPGHKYFPVNPNWIKQAKFERIEDGRTFEMATTTTRKPVYKDFALLKFEHDAKTYTLHAYQNVELSKKEEYADYLFLPFNDHTNGMESYGGGRYIDLRIPNGAEIKLDFNQSYNPYCAYNGKYSCPIPPEENKLPFRVEAGIMKYH